MEVQLVQIGNSKGIVFPENYIKNLGDFDKMDLFLESNHIIIKPRYKPRKGWDNAFKQMHLNEDDKLVIDDVFHDEDFE